MMEEHTFADTVGSGIDHRRDITRAAGISVLLPDTTKAIQSIENLDVLMLNITIAEEDRSLLHARHTSANNDNSFASRWRHDIKASFRGFVTVRSRLETQHLAITIATQHTSAEGLDRGRGSLLRPAEAF